MAFEAVSQLHAAVKYDGDTETILARTGIASVVRSAQGIYIVTLSEAVANNAEVRAFALEDATPRFGAVTRTSPTTYQVRIVAPGGAEVDLRWNLVIYALTNRG